MALCGGCRAYLCGERGQMGESRCSYLILQPAFAFWCRLECAERGLTSQGSGRRPRGGGCALDGVDGNS